MIGVREAQSTGLVAAGPMAGQLRGPILRGAVLTLGAAGIHFAVVPMHLQEYTLLGLALLAIALAQCALAAALALAPSRRVALAAVAANMLFVAAWATSRTVGVPIGPRPGQPEAAGTSDVSASLLEVLAATVLLASVLRPLHSRRPRPGPARLFGARTISVTAVTLVLVISGIMGAASDAPLGLNMSAPVAAGHGAVPMGSLREAPGDQSVRSFRLVAERRTIHGQEAWTFNGVVPGPELRVTEGDRLRVTLVNHLPAATAIHWHGLRLPNADDGVPGVTQDAVPPGGTYTYDFVVKDPGTYWYHTHQNAVDQLSRGLFGALVVEPRSGPVADRDYAVVLHALPSPGLEPGLLGFLPLFGTPPAAFDGRPGDLHLDARPGERVRLRVVGAVEGEPDGALRMIGLPEELVLLGTGYQVAALDGHDLSGPQVIGPQRIRVGMGQRYDLVFTMPAAGAVRVAAVRGPETVTVGDGPPPKVPNLERLPLFDPSGYGMQAPDPVLAGRGFDAAYRAGLGNGAGFLDNQPEFVHTINGAASPSMATFVVRTGQLVLLHILNETDEFHSMHLHGHWLSVLAVNGRGIRGSPLHLDSLLMGPRESFDVAFLADNPGLWMFHCHVMLHSALGMSAMVVYQDVTTPYQVGSRSGNMPE
jgi:FtsP/CotA-like multicopper oxidase with cupredoxin domain